MFRRTKRSLGIESLEQRELLAADLLAMGPDPAALDDPGQVAQTADTVTAGPTLDPFGVDDHSGRKTRRLKPWGVDDGVAANASDLSANHPDPFDVHDQSLRKARRLQPWGVDNGGGATADLSANHPDPFDVHDQSLRKARRLTPWGVRDGSATADLAANHPDPFGTDDGSSAARPYEKPTGRRPIRPLGLEDVVTANINDGTDRPAPFGTEEVRFETNCVNHAAEAGRIQPHQVDEVMRLR